MSNQERVVRNVNLVCFLCLTALFILSLNQAANDTRPRSFRSRYPSPELDTSDIEIVWDSRVDGPPDSRQRAIKKQEHPEGRRHDLGSQNSSVFPPSRSSPSTSRAGSAEAPDPQATSTVMADCLLCGPPAELSVGVFTNRLFALLDNDVYLLQALASLGIRFDQHLDFLLRMDKTFRERLIVCIPSDKVNPVAKHRLLERLERASEGYTAEYFTELSERQTIANVVQIPCSAEGHPVLDITDEVSDELWHDLHSRGLGELLPAFAHMKVFSSDDFVCFCQLDDKRRASALARARLTLSDFQRVMMDFAVGVAERNVTGWSTSHILSIRSREVEGSLRSISS